MTKVTLLDTDINAAQIWDELFPILTDHNLLDRSQVGLTSLTGDSWDECIGRIADLKFPEKYYSTLHTALKGTAVEQVINRYPNFYRWRLLCIEPKSTYSIHKDSLNSEQTNLRLHVPIQTNSKSFMCFYNEMPVANKIIPVQFEHLAINNSYIVDTSGLHTAVNYGNTHRYHIVGVRYENSNNRAY